VTPRQIRSYAGCVPAAGILTYGAYLPFHRLDRSAIAAVAGTGGGTGTRTVASYDEDTTTMAVEAARGVPASRPRDLGSLWFATTTPAYADKTNATAVHAALGLDTAVPAFDANGAVRSAMGALRAGLDSSASGPALVVAADLRTGLPGSADESAGGDGAAALLVGHGDGDGAGRVPLLAELLAWGSATAEFLDRWRIPGEQRSRLWEERFGEGRYLDAGQRAWDAALATAGLAPTGVDHVVVVGSHARAATALARKLDLADRLHPAVGRLAADVGFTGAAHPALALAGALDEAAPGQVVALVVLADGADVVLWQATDALAAHQRRLPADPVTADAGSSVDRVPTDSPAPPLTAEAGWPPPPAAAAAERTSGSPAGAGLPPAAAAPSRAAGQPRRGLTLADQIAAGGPVTYGRYLAWRGILPVEPPRRPEPARPSASAAGRSTGWKFGFVGSESQDGVVHLPPSPLDPHDRSMADATGTIATFTIDRMAYSPSPPVVFAVVDFDGGGRLPVELTDVDPAGVKIGDRVEMTFRKLFTADGIHNYFWKARPIRGRPATSVGSA
jgi:hydroxymethylglutaryl-CoA synthase